MQTRVVAPTQRERALIGMLRRTLSRCASQSVAAAMRLLQMACNHPCMVKKALYVSEKSLDTMISAQAARDRMRQHKHTAEAADRTGSGQDLAASMAECPICLEPIQELCFVTECMHAFCTQCLETALRQAPRCP